MHVANDVLYYKRGKSQCEIILSRPHKSDKSVDVNTEGGPPRVVEGGSPHLGCSVSDGAGLPRPFRRLRTVMVAASWAQVRGCCGGDLRR
jgi:hypothetical protein